MNARAAARRSSVVCVIALIAASCSSGGDTSGDDTSPTSLVAPESESTPTEPTGTEPADTDPPAAAPDTVPVDTEPVDTEPVDTEPPFVIDGPAQVTQGCSEVTRGLTETTLDAGGAVHDVRIYVPEELGDDPAPVVLNWHGLGSNGAEQAALSGYETLADESGFIVVHPTGVPIDDGGPNSWELAVFDDPARDDLAFADALIDSMIADWCGDPLRIYSTGMSNGGFFTAELVCNRSERIAAAVSVAGTSHPESCEPSRAVPYAAFHGTADDVVPFAGGESVLGGDDSDLGGGGFFDQVMPDEFAEFAADAACDVAAARTEVTEQVIRYDYANCADDVPMTFYELPGSGHTWPDSPLAAQLTEFGVFATDISATADGWAFMSSHTL